MQERVFRIADRHAETPGAYRRLAYTDWGSRDSSRVALCVHGLTRNARDFDALAEVLSATHRVLAVDLAGRGRSDWLRGADGYVHETYLADLRTLLASLGILKVDWIGTSMGGILGMKLAGSEDPVLRSMVRRLVLNDIGPFLPAAGMVPIAERVGRAPDFAGLAEAEAYQRQVCAEWGALSAKQWAHLARHSMREKPGGGLAYHHDPALGDALRAAGPVVDVVFWEFWDRIACPVLVMRGADSNILLAETAEEMRTRGPGAQRLVLVAEWPDVGHTPSLMREGEIETVAGWLTAD